MYKRNLKRNTSLFFSEEAMNAWGRKNIGLGAEQMWVQMQSTTYCMCNLNLFKLQSFIYKPREMHGPVKPCLFQYKDEGLKWLLLESWWEDFREICEKARSCGGQREAWVMSMLPKLPSVEVRHPCFQTASRTQLPFFYKMGMKTHTT